MKINTIQDLNSIKEAGIKRILPSKPMISVGMGTCGIGNGADVLYNKLKQIIKDKKLNVILEKTGCFGFCAAEPLVNVYIPGKPLVILNKVTEKDAQKILDDIQKITPTYKKNLCRIESWDFHTSTIEYGKGFEKIPLWNEIPFFKWQKKIVLRDCGIINPDDIDQYIGAGGYFPLYKTIHELDPDRVIEEVKKSKLRGRGGAGFPTGLKWNLMKLQKAEQKFVICNADEGDPGAYMNRNEVESDPHMLIEGMIIGAYAMGASEGIIYMRAEYPLAVQRILKAIEKAKEYGILGNNIMGTRFSFNLNLVEGAGAFVCGEETALTASIEGKAGRPLPRPPFPAEKGLWGKPSNINNVETWCNIPVIMAKGGDWFTKTGTEKSAGTKVFSLVGKVKNTGLVELPLGSTLDTLVFEIGEGTGNRKRIKAVQSGGPSGGCVPISLFNTPVDYESLTAIGAIMGSGGMVVMDQDNCMVDVARYFTEFTHSESCGKCTPCREGLSQSLRTLNNITQGNGTIQEIEQLELLGSVIKDSALCGLGQTSANPVLTTLRYFKNEYEEHILGKRCYSGTCEKLYLALCENSCPLHMNIPGYLQLIKEDRIEEAFELTLRDNPLPGTLGRICHFHCQMRCRRDTVDEPVSQGEIHRYLADTLYKIGREKVIYDRLIQEKKSPSGKKVAIIGAGPAGLTLAYYLIRLGHEVTVYDNHPKAGGVLRYGIPEYRLPKDVLDKEIEFIKKLGVKFIFKTRIGAEITLKTLQKENDLIYFAIGAWKEIGLNIPGENTAGVIHGIDFLEKMAAGKPPKIGKKVLVVGAGNVAIDAARSIWRLGSDVTIVYRREKQDMPANEIEIKEAEAEGIKFIYMAAPNKIIEGNKGQLSGLEIMKMKSGGFDHSGRRRPVTSGETAMINCDTIILAVGESVDSEYAGIAGLNISKTGTITVNPFTYETSIPGVYAGGDAASGPATAAEAMGMAKKAAEAIDFKLMGENRFRQLFKTYSYQNVVPPVPEGGKRNYGKSLPVHDRALNFIEVSSGYTGEQARMEAMRCLRCDVREEK